MRNSLSALPVARPFERSSQVHQIWALLAASAFAAISLGAIPLARQAAPTHDAVAIAAFVWIAAELLTALLLLGEFYVSGLLYYAIASYVFATAGAVSLAFSFGFSGHTAVADPARMQIVAWLFVVRGVFFAVGLGALQLFDPTMRRRILTGCRTNAVIVTLAAAIVLTTGALVALCLGLRAAFPTFFSGSGEAEIRSAFTLVMPSVGLLTAGAIVIFLRRLRSLGVLQVWLVVSLLAAACDAALDVLAPDRTNVGWYAGAIDMIGSALVVLTVLFLEVISNYRRLTDQARLDPLTNLRNRRSFDYELAWALGESVRSGKAVTLIALDIDHFKKYNDRYGHPAGDATLSTVARAISTSIPADEAIAGRCGGEEFVVLLPGFDTSAALEIAERLRADIEALAISHADSPHGVLTISVGVATVEPAELSAPLLLQRADQALYESKNQGRNQTTPYTATHLKLTLGEQVRSERVERSG